jgi:hypothetical protein
MSLALVMKTIMKDSKFCFNTSKGEEFNILIKRDTIEEMISDGVLKNEMT